jgi:hypothetical protein
MIEYEIINISYNVVSALCVQYLVTIGKILKRLCSAKCGESLHRSDVPKMPVMLKAKDDEFVYFAVAFHLFLLR